MTTAMPMPQPQGHTSASSHFKVLDSPPLSPLPHNFAPVFLEDNCYTSDLTSETRTTAENVPKHTSPPASGQLKFTGARLGVFPSSYMVIAEIFIINVIFGVRSVAKETVKK